MWNFKGMLNSWIFAEFDHSIYILKLMLGLRICIPAAACRCVLHFYLLYFVFYENRREAIKEMGLFMFVNSIRWCLPVEPTAPRKSFKGWAFSILKMNALVRLIYLLSATQPNSTRAVLHLFAVLKRARALKLNSSWRICIDFTSKFSNKNKLSITDGISNKCCY